MLGTQHGHLDYQTCLAQSGMIWARVIHHAHGRRSNTVQLYRSVFPGHWSYQMEQSHWEAMPWWQWPCKSKFWKVNPGLPEAVTRLSNIGNQLTCWLCVAKKPVFMLIHEFMQHQTHYSATLTTATSIGQWSCQQRRRRANRSSLHNLRCISTCSEMNMTVLPPSLHQQWRK